MTKAITFKYNPEENMRTILMDKKTKFVVVEGEDDLSKYESTLRAIVPNDIDFEPIFVGGKDKIKHLLSITKNQNFMAIADADFNAEGMPADSRLLVISRYSIENFLFCNNVLIPFIANLISDTESNVRSWFGIADWIDHLKLKLPFLLKSLYYYQTNVLTGRKSWSSEDLNENNSWKICSLKIKSLIESLFDNVIPTAEIENVDKFGTSNEINLIKVFPGKLLINSLYRYIREKMMIKFGNAKKLTSKIGNQNTLIIGCSPFLHRQTDLKNELTSIVNFLLPKQAFESI